MPSALTSCTELRRLLPASTNTQTAVARLVAFEHRRLQGSLPVDQAAALGHVGLPHPLAQCVVGRVGTLAVARRRLGHAQQEGSHGRHRGADQRHLDYLPATGVLTGVKGQGGRQRAVNGAVGGGQRDRRVLRRRLQLPADRVQVGEQAGGRTQHPFEGTQRSAFLAGAETGQRQVHQARVGGGHGRRPQAQALHHPRAGSSRLPRPPRPPVAGPRRGRRSSSGPAPAPACRG